MTASKRAIRIKLFNYVDIQCNGQSIFKEKQITSKLKSLLQYFIVNRGTICKPEKIIEELWPDNKYIERKKVLQTYVHRLRNALAKDNTFGWDFSDEISILNVKGSYQMVVSQEVELDTEIFIQLTRKAHQFESYEELNSLAEALEIIYDGHYLSDSVHEHLVQRQQNYYLQAYCGAMSAILDKLAKMEKYDEVINFCERFFKIEDLDDSINVAFINALIKAGQLTYAVRHYHYLEKRMMEVFGIPPSEELTKLYNTLSENQPSSNPSPQPNHASPLDDELLKTVISKLIAEKIQETKIKYAFAKITVSVLNPQDEGLISELLENTLRHSLRKNDMFTLLYGNTAIALLYEAKIEHLGVISNRITSFVSEKYAGIDAEVDVKIWPITNVI